MPPRRLSLLSLLLYLISPGFKDSSWSILLEGLRGKMGPFGIHGGHPNQAFHQGLNFISFAQCSVGKRCTKFKKVCMRIRKMACFGKQCFRDWKRWTYHRRNTYPVKDKASRERTSGRSGPVKI